MKWSDVENALKDLEGPYQDFKESTFLKDTKEIAAQLVSFANRSGGKIYVGVKDDGSLEGATIHKDKSSLHVLNVANNNCSPAVEVRFDYLNSSSGDVLIVNATLCGRKKCLEPILSNSSLVSSSTATLDFFNYYLVV
jgi:ATP-dependent DNA helicase RecG